MAYEAVGRTDEAITVYTKLTQSRIEDIKSNAKRLLYGIEAIQFMRNDIRDSNFSRKKVSQDFMDLTGFDNMAANFDKVYNTAYIDLDKRGNYYKRLTESVVRSSREARLILMQAVFAGEVDRLRIVQALRLLNREFDSELRAEADRAKIKEESAFVPLINGAPIVQRKKEEEVVDDDIDFTTMEKFRLGSPEQMMRNFDGEWRLQFTADKKGDGVKFFNATLAWQKIDTESMEFEYLIPAGLMTAKRTGSLSYNRETRTIERSQQSGSGGSFLFPLLPLPSAAAPVLQIICVDSELCITRIAGKKVAQEDNVKEYFSVWKRVVPGAFTTK